MSWSHGYLWSIIISLLSIYNGIMIQFSPAVIFINVGNEDWLLTIKLNWLHFKSSTLFFKLPFIISASHRHTFTFIYQLSIPMSCLYPSTAFIHFYLVVFFSVKPKKYLRCFLERANYILLPAVRICSLFLHSFYTSYSSLFCQILILLFVLNLLAHICLF